MLGELLTLGLHLLPLEGLVKVGGLIKFDEANLLKVGELTVNVFRGDGAPEQSPDAPPRPVVAAVGLGDRVEVIRSPRSSPPPGAGPSAAASCPPEPARPAPAPPLTPPPTPQEQAFRLAMHLEIVEARRLVPRTSFILGKRVLLAVAPGDESRMEVQSFRVLPVPLWFQFQRGRPVGIWRSDMSRFDRFRAGLSKMAGGEWERRRLPAGSPHVVGDAIAISIRKEFDGEVWACTCSTRNDHPHHYVFVSGAPRDATGRLDHAGPSVQDRRRTRVRVRDGERPTRQAR